MCVVWAFHSMVGGSEKRKLLEVPGWLKLVEHVTFDLRVVSLSPTLGMEPT